MNLNSYDIVYIFGTFFMTYVIYKFMRVFYIERNTSKRMEIGSYLIYFVVTIALYLFVKNPTLLMISNLAFFIALGLNYKGSFKKKDFSSSTYIYYSYVYRND